MSRATMLVAALLVLLQGAELAAQPVCKPALAVKDVRFSGVFNLKRLWTATVHVDASRCATRSGLFSLGFVRLAENAPDLEFTEPSIWNAGPTSVRVEFWADEAVHRYWLSDVATCPCRGD